jgi:uncharacterized protein (TIGR02266 family)
MRCPTCSEQLPEDARFCGACGSAIGAPAQAASADPIPLTKRKGSSPAASNQRSSHRANLDVDVTFTSEHNFYTGFVENLSAGGLFVATHDLRKIGESVEVRFTIPGRADPCVAQATVRWLRDVGLGPHAAPGMGLQFSNLDGRLRQEIEAFIALRDPMFYDD